MSKPVFLGDDGPMTAGDCARWLEAKYSRHRELEDKASADLIRWQAEEIARLTAIVRGAGETTSHRFPRDADGDIPPEFLRNVRRTINTALDFYEIDVRQIEHVLVALERLTPTTEARQPCDCGAVTDGNGQRAHRSGCAMFHAATDIDFEGIEAGDDADIDAGYR